MILGLKEILYKLKFEFFYVQTNSKLKNRDEERVVPIPHPEVILCPNGLLLRFSYAEIIPLLRGSYPRT